MSQKGLRINFNYKAKFPSQSHRLLPRTTLVVAKFAGFRDSMQYFRRFHKKRGALYIVLDSSVRPQKYKQTARLSS